MLRSSASDVLSDWVYMAGLHGAEILTYNKINNTQAVFVTYLLGLKSPPKFLPGRGQRAGFVAALLVEPSLGWLEQAPKNLAAELAGRPSRPILRQQRRRRQRIAQHHPAVVMDQQDAGG